MHGTCLESATEQVCVGQDESPRVKIGEGGSSFIRVGQDGSG